MIAAGVLIGAGLGLFLLVAIGAFGLNLFDRGSAAPVGANSLIPAVGKPLPDFQLERLDSSGLLDTQELRGHPLVVNFWATWCGPCRLEMPMFEEYHQRFGEDVQFLAVNDGETRAEVQDFVDELGLTFDILLDPGYQVSDQYQIRAFPTTYFVDAKGTVQAVHIGLLSEGQLKDYLEQVGVNTGL